MAVNIDTNHRMRLLNKEDSAALTAYFESLGAESKKRFQPHPLTAELAQALCESPETGVLRFVVEHSNRIIAYFILDPRMSRHEAGRFSEFGIELESGKDYLFAPSVADEFQNTGIASKAMPHLLATAKAAGARSLVLMGGTQATNPRAIAFYEKFGFQKFGGYQTEVFNHDMRLSMQ